MLASIHRDYFDRNTKEEKNRWTRETMMCNYGWKRQTNIFSESRNRNGKRERTEDANRIVEFVVEDIQQSGEQLKW